MLGEGLGVWRTVQVDEDGRGGGAGRWGWEGGEML